MQKHFCPVSWKCYLNILILYLFCEGDWEDKSPMQSGFCQLTFSAALNCPHLTRSSAWLQDPCTQLVFSPRVLLPWISTLLAPLHYLGLHALSYMKQHPPHVRQNQIPLPLLIFLQAPTALANAQPRFKTIALMTSTEKVLSQKGLQKLDFRITAPSL